jgi:hypothetical protein
MISTTAPRYSVVAYRMGSYPTPQGVRGGATIWGSGPLPGRHQPSARLLPATRTTYAPWTPSLTVQTAGWPPGDYLFTVTTSTGRARWIPLTVRSPSTAGKLVLLSAVTTWQAYNRWGGYSLYQGPSGAAADRSRAVSFDRPYTADFGGGSADFSGNELPVVQLAEKLHLPVAYATDVDLHDDPGLLDGAVGVVSLGHDEYYSAAMRDALGAARQRGTNLAFIGANAIYRHIRFAATPLGPDRLEIDYKSFAQDPVHRTAPAAATAQWRDAPVSRPESVLTGAFYACNPVHTGMVVADPDSWLLAGLGLHRGQVLPGLVGSEFDRVGPAPTPQPIDVLFHSPVVCGGRPGYADAAYYSTPEGAGVFDSGTSGWVCALAPACTDLPPVDHTVVTAITARLLTGFAAGPAGRSHPAQSDLGPLRIPVPPAAPPYHPVGTRDPVDPVAAERFP